MATYKTEPTPVGATLAQLRASSGLSLRQLAEKSGVHFATIHCIETGKTKSPSSDVLGALARALGVSLDLLAGVHTRRQRRAS